MAPVYLVGIDGSNCSSRAVAYAKERAQASGGTVVVAHIIEWSPFSFSTLEENEQRHKRREKELERAHEQIVDPIVDSIRADGIEVSGVVRHGDVASTLARLARKSEATCIIVGHHGTAGLKAKIFGGVPSKLVQITDRPLTVVP